MQLTHYLNNFFLRNKNTLNKVLNQHKCLFYPFIRMNFSTEQPKDYYKILGVPKTASESEIKSAYTKLSKKYHPDMNKAPDANDRFAEINNAYDTLHDSEKRKHYDMTGDPSQQYYETSSGNPFSGYSSTDSIFNDLFSNLFTSRQRQQSSSDRGTNLQITLTVSFEEAALGAKIPTRFQRINVCEECKGSRSKSGQQPITCPSCKGNGVHRKMQGNMILQTTCSKCSGLGKLIADPCTKCNGKGRTLQTIVEDIEVPQGIDHGQQYKITGMGNHGSKSKGDLIVMINVQKSKYYQRQGFDVVTKLKLKVTDAIFGTTAKIKTLHGEKEIKIHQGAQYGEKIRIQNFGIQKINQRKNYRGDHYVFLDVEIPRKLSKREKELYEELRKLEEKEKKKFY